MQTGDTGKAPENRRRGQSVALDFVIGKDQICKTISEEEVSSNVFECQVQKMATTKITFRAPPRNEKIGFTNEVILDP